MPPEAAPIADSARYWAKVDRSGPNGCWIWTASKNEWGYGQFNVNGRTSLAHRVGWMLQNGSVPDRLLVIHRCDNPACVSPDHLFLGTFKDNTADMDAKGRGGRSRLPGEANPSVKLTEAEVLDIRSAYKRGDISQYLLADQYQVHRVTIHRIVTGKKWKHLLEAA